MLQSRGLHGKRVVDTNNNKTMKETTTKKKKRKKKKQIDLDGNNDRKQNIARSRSSMIALCLAAMMWMMFMASNGIVVDGFVLSSNVHRLDDVMMIMEQDVVAAIGSSDVCNQLLIAMM